MNYIEGKYMKCIIIFLLVFQLLSCATNNSFNLYLKENNIKIEFSAEDSKYITRDFETFDLSGKQNKCLDNFIKLFYSNNEYIKNILNKNTFEYKIKKIDIFENYNGINYGVYIIFYSNEKLVDYSKYNETNGYWETFNIALYRIEKSKLIFIGWHF